MHSRSSARLAILTVALGAVVAVVAGAPPAGAAVPPTVANPADSVAPAANASESAGAVGGHGWSQFLGGPRHHGWNRFEQRITPKSAPTLRRAWSAPIEASGYTVNSGSPIIVGATVVIGGGAVTARNLDAGDLLWRRKLRGVVLTTPAWSGRSIVVTETPDWVSGRTFSGVAALDAATGAVKWERRLDAAGESSPTVVGQSVLVSHPAGVVRLRLSDGSVVWRTRLPDGYVSSPTSDGKAVYVSHSHGSAVSALDIRTGRQLWRVTAGSMGVTTDGFAPALIDGIVYAPLHGIGMIALSAATGDELWRTPPGDTFWWGLSTDGRRMIGSSEGTHVVAVDRRTGEPLWSRDLPGLARAAAVAGGVALIAGQDTTGRNQVDLLDAATGAALGAIALPDVGGDLTNSPMPVAVSRGRVAVANWDRLVVLALPAR